MIAPTDQFRSSAIVDEFDRPLQVPVEPIHASYDAARTTDEFKNYWANADWLGPNAENSQTVRHTLMHRARYNEANDGYIDGMTLTHANFMVRRVPKLRMETENADFNDQIERRFMRWVKAIGFRRKLHCMAQTKSRDGEAFGILVNNPRIQNAVQLDLKIFEAEQCDDRYSDFSASGRPEGVIMDDFDNVVAYRILREHPGSNDAFSVSSEADLIPEPFITHWYKLRRPGTVRAVTEWRSVLNCTAGSRRFREATLSAAETAADFTLWLKSTLGVETAAQLTPFQKLEIQKRMMAIAPEGWEPMQLKAEHPNAQYREFFRQQIQEQGRPKSIPVNVGQADSSEHNFASGKLDHQSWFAEIEVDREDCNDLVLSKVFQQWSLEASMVYGFNGTAMDWPHSWDWPVLPVADEKAQAQADDINLRNGSLSLTEAFSKKGKDFEEQVRIMARDYFGEPTDENVMKVRQALFDKLLGTNSPVQEEASNGEQIPEEAPA